MKKKIVAWIIAGGVAVAGGGTAAGVAIANTPKNVTARAVAGVFQDFQKREEISPILNMLSKGSLQASISSFKVNGKEQFQNTQYSGKLYFSEKAIALENCIIKNDNVNLEGNAYISEDLIYIQEENALYDAYGLNPNHFADDLANSIFAYDSGSYYAIPDENLYNLILDALDNANNKQMRKDAKKIVDKYVKKLCNIALDNFSYSSTSEYVRLQGEKTSARVITVEMDNDALINIIEDAYDFISEDKSIVEFMEKYENQLAVFYRQIPYDYNSLSEWYEDFFIENAGAYVDEMCYAIEHYGFPTITAEIVTPQLSAKVLKCNLLQGRTQLLSVDFGKKGVKETEKFSIDFGETDIVYEITSNNNQRYKSVLTVDGYDYFSLNINKQRKSYTACILEDTVVTGFVTKDNDSISITVDTITANYGTINYQTNLSILIKEKDKMPSAPKNYNTIADIKERDIENWKKRLLGK